MRRSHGGACRVHGSRGIDSILYIIAFLFLFLGKNERERKSARALVLVPQFLPATNPIRFPVTLPELRCSPQYHLLGSSQDQCVYYLWLRGFSGQQQDLRSGPLAPLFLRDVWSQHSSFRGSSHSSSLRSLSLNNTNCLYLLPGLAEPGSAISVLCSLQTEWGGTKAPSIVSSTSYC